MNSFYLTCSVLALTTSLVACLAVRTSQDLRSHCAQLGAALLDVTRRAAELEARLAELARFDRTIAGRVDKLAANEGRLESSGNRTGFTEAIALIEHGAKADELIEACGLGTAEARLVEALYGRVDVTPDAGNTPDTIVVDARLNVVGPQAAA
jgi:hypothetical protein